MLKSRKTAPFSPEYQHFCRVLKDAREKAGMTQTTLAKRLKKYQSFVAKYESGERRLDVIEFVRICRMLSIEPAKVISRLG